MNLTTLKPTNGYVVLKPVEEEEIMAGAIIVPDLGKEKPAIGEVIAKSPFYNFNTGELVNGDFEVGDTVLIPKLGSQRVTLSGVEFYLCKVVEVIGIIQNEKQ